MNIPEKHLAKCEFCNNELDISAEGVSQYTSGWVKNRTGGGGHGISLPKRESRWAHSHCIDRIAKGYAKQVNLL